MADDREQVIQAGMAAFNRGDMPAVLAVLDEDVEVFAHEDVGNPGRFHGRDGYREWLGAWLEAWDDFRVEVLAVESLGDEDALVTVDQFGRGKGSGVDVVRRGMVFHFRFCGGFVTRLGLYPDRSTAVAELGDAAR